MTREEAHSILAKCLDEAEKQDFYGQMSFVLHLKAGKLQQVTDERWKRTWRGMPSVIP